MVRNAIEVEIKVIMVISLFIYYLCFSKLLTNKKNNLYNHYCY